jgi:hypothetical protein
MASFGVRGKIFATLPDDDHVRVSWAAASAWGGHVRRETHLAAPDKARTRRGRARLIGRATRGSSHGAINVSDGQAE